jgi:hypothetical protein
MSLSNAPKLSKRAAQALELLANGGEMVERLERNSYTGREQFALRFFASKGRANPVKGLSYATRRELEKAGFNFKIVHSTSVSTAYQLRHG